MDLDDFKTINDSLGHAAGDLVLGEVGERLKTCLRAADTGARLGGDEFAILLEDSTDGIEATEVAARILTALEGAFQLENKEVFVRASIGIATADSRADPVPKAPKSCCATPTSRCTWPRKRARAATRCSSRRCTTPRCAASS